MLSINQLKFSYPSGDFSLEIDSVNFEKGSITAVVGGNGCGKTTLFRLLSGVYKPESPCFSYNQRTVESCAELKCNIVTHNAFGGLNDRLTVWQNIQFVARLYDRELSREDIEEMALDIGFADYINRLPVALSAGQYQKAMLLRTLASNPTIVTLDEPTTALDVIGIETTLNWIESLKKLGKTVIISTHHLYELAHLKPDIIGLNNGKVVCKQRGDEELSNQQRARDLIRSIIGEQA